MPITKGYADTRNGQIHYRRCGPGEGTPLVFLHQTASSSKMYEKVMALLEGEYPMVALDTPGFGGSYDPPEYPDLPYYVAVLLEALDDLGVGDFHLFGHHTGACIGVEMAVKVPDRVETLMMIGPVQLTQDERDELRKHFSSPFAPQADGAHLMQTWEYLADLGADASLELHHRELVDTVRAWKGRAQAYATVWDQDFPALFARVKCPVLIMCSADDVLWAYFDRAKAARPDAKAVVLRGANFEPDLDAEGTANAIRAFLGERA